MKSALGITLVALLAACTVGPDYRRPVAETPPTWQTDSYWRVGEPSHAPLALDWWQGFGDVALSGLETQALGQNQTLAAASAHYAQARATLAQTSSLALPEIDLGANASRSRISRNRPVNNYATPNSTTVQNDLKLAPTVNYDVDLFGRIRREVEAAHASADQSRDDLANARLVLTTDLASDYFSMRELDAEIDVLNRSVVLQKKALDYVQTQHDLGAVSGLDVLQQQAQLDQTRVQAQLLLNQRAQFEHAIAALVGTPAPQFSIAPELNDRPLPPIPLGIPSDVLQRRPDVASAERSMAAANAQIGVATAAFYPSVNLLPTGGVDSRSLSTLFDAQSVLWSIGVSATQTIFDGGRIRANVDFTKAGYEATVASYRRVVLTAMQEAEDGITGLASLERAAAQSQTAVASARRVLEMSASRYEGGATTFLDVITAQQALLNIERQAAQVSGQRMLGSVFLVKALGGDWCGVEARGAGGARKDCPAPLRQVVGTR